MVLLNNHKERIELCAGDRPVAHLCDLCITISQSFIGLRKFLRGTHIRRNAIYISGAKPPSLLSPATGEMQEGDLSAVFIGCGFWPR